MQNRDKNYFVCEICRKTTSSTRRCILCGKITCVGCHDAITGLCVSCAPKKHKSNPSKKRE